MDECGVQLNSYRVSIFRLGCQILFLYNRAMAIYAIGDIQGHLHPLQRLLNDAGFNPQKDQLWIVGDLVNRGPDSLGVLRFVRDLGDAAKPVLGNHDLRLLALHAGVVKERKHDTLQDVLKAPDCQELLHWLRHVPLVRKNREMKTIMIHAGIPKAWTRKETVTYAKEAAAALQGKNFRKFLKDIHTNKIQVWKKSFSTKKRLNFCTNALTRMRYCSPTGDLDFQDKGPLGTQKRGLIPWFRVSKRAWDKWRIVFGHWSTLGYLKEGNVLSLDSGCHWGKLLTLTRLDSDKDLIWQYSCG